MLAYGLNFPLVLKKEWIRSSLPKGLQRSAISPAVFSFFCLSLVLKTQLHNLKFQETAPDRYPPIYHGGPDSGESGLRVVSCQWPLHPRAIQCQQSRLLDFHWEFCSMLQCVAVCYGVLHSWAIQSQQARHSNFNGMFGSVLQCVAVC